MAERGEAPSPKRPRVDNTQQGSSKKYSGASIYKSKFQAGWQKRWPCVTPVNNNPHSFHCTLCKKVVSCGHQGERDVTRHIASVQHKRNAEAVKTTHTLSFASCLSKDKVKPIAISCKICLNCLGNTCVLLYENV